MNEDEWDTTSDRRTMSGAELATISIYDASKSQPFTLGNWNGRIVTFHPDGTVEVHGDTYEAAKAFWDYVKQFAAAEYAKHVAAHHEIRDLSSYVAERNAGKE